MSSSSLGVLWIGLKLVLGSLGAWNSLLRNLVGNERKEHLVLTAAVGCTRSSLVNQNISSFRKIPSIFSRNSLSAGSSEGSYSSGIDLFDGERCEPRSAWWRVRNVFGLLLANSMLLQLSLYEYH